MTPTRVRRTKWAACAILLSTLAPLCTAPASADPIDDSFVAALAKDGISMPDRGTAVSMAHSVCAGFDKGEPSTQLAMRIVKDTDLSAKQAGYFVGVSVAAYCPQYRGNTDNSFNWAVPFPPMMSACAALFVLGGAELFWERRRFARTTGNHDPFQGCSREGPLLVMRLMRDTNLTARPAGFFMGISASAYCPQYRTAVSG